MFFFNNYTHFKSMLNTIIFEPLDIFDIYFFFSGISINNLAIGAIFTLTIFTLIFFTNYRFLAISNINYLYLFRLQLFGFICNVFRTNISLSKPVSFILFSYIFLFILFSNIVGIIPFGFTITCSFIIAFFCSFIIFFSINCIAIYKTGFLPFLGIFKPSGAPLVIAPLLILIELVSYFARLLSLAIRLFANMMSGHALLKILGSFSFVILTSTGSLFFFSCIP